MTHVTGNRQPQRALRPPRFRGTRELKFSPVDQAAIRAAERAFGYTPQHPTTPQHQPFGLGWLFPLAAAMFFFFLLLAAVATLFDARLSRPAPISTESSVQSAGIQEVSPSTPPSPAVVPPPQPVEATSQSAPGSQPVSPALVSTDGNGGAYSGPPKKGEANQQGAPDVSPRQVPPPPDQHPVERKEALPADPGPAGTTWHRFGQPPANADASGWKSFEQPQPQRIFTGEENGSAPLNTQEPSRSPQPRRTTKRHSFLRRALGRAGHTIQGAARRVFSTSPPDSVWPSLPDDPSVGFSPPSLLKERKGGWPL
jgi:hypothetical protein